MISFLEVIDRAFTGPLCSEKDFNLNNVTRMVREVVKEYGIRYDPATPLPSDNSLADDVFNAAMKFYSETGTYCPDTQRIIRFDEDEIKEALRDAPNGTILGEEKDAKKLVARKPESKEPPFCSVGACGAPISTEEIFTSIVQGYGSIPRADSLTSPGLTTVNGMKIVSGSPLEVYGAIRTVVLAREALRRVGRPGLPIVNGLATAITDAATIAGSHFGMRSSDGWEIGSIAEMKLDFDRLNKVAYLTSMGGNILGENGPVLGGYCGGPEGTAVVTTAYTLQDILVHRSICQHSFPIHHKYGCTTAGNLLWTLSVASQAVSRNTHFPLLNCCYTAAGPMTEMCFYETAAWVIASVVSGASVEVEGSAKATHIDHLSPLEPRFGVDVAHAIVGMKREAANDLVKRLLSKYEDKIDDPPLGKKFQECFNIVTGRPSGEHSSLYSRMRREMEDYGLMFD
ncbi:MAG: monomethylamine:corrinoid methyltransferase [Nitrososphaeria archaeon]|nr:monomethylamine:corrinoid methyltransferase [Nitrososphaeria archaeon]NIN52474.1 monomethylamine:corrinoid methyltransferase [Nitrososphaeria archaeon]NIQ32980.1 monomethylamine:corrinoid methyltransferase [Nitrososphaeria archaeon]